MTEEALPETQLTWPITSSAYRLLQVVGEGASATVWKAHCVTLDRIVAIKIIDLEGTMGRLDDIRRETHFWSLAKHPNIVPLFTSFVAGSKVWFIMKYMLTGSCHNILRTAAPTGFDENISVAILYETLKGLKYFHDNGNIHRDIKAGNILIDDEGVVQVADFGVAGSMIESGLRRDIKTSFVGTPCWMAPEVILGREEGYDSKADIWSLGITAIELATGTPPHIREKPMKILIVTVKKPPPTLPKAIQYSKQYSDFVEKCLRKDPNERPNATQLLKHKLFKSVAKKNVAEFLKKNLTRVLRPLAQRAEQLHHPALSLIDFQKKHNTTVDAIIQGVDPSALVENEPSLKSSKLPDTELAPNTSQNPSSSSDTYIHGISAFNFKIPSSKSSISQSHSSTSNQSSNSTQLLGSKKIPMIMTTSTPPTEFMEDLELEHKNNSDTSESTFNPEAAPFVIELDETEPSTTPPLEEGSSDQGTLIEGMPSSEKSDSSEASQHNVATGTLLEL